MKILITGASGFVGTYLSRFLLDGGHQVTAIGTRPAHGRIGHERFSYLSADTTEPGPWQHRVAACEAAVNLAGRSIFTRWSEKARRRIYDSRISTTRNLVEAIPEATPFTLCSASAVGYYGDRGEALLAEDQPGGTGFLARLGRDWETEAFRARQKGARVVTMRYGVVLGRGGGAMEKLVPAFRLMLGGPLGNGRQWFPWIHINDLLAATGFVLTTAAMDGPVNFCAPEPVRNMDLARTLGLALKRPAVMPAPAFVLRALLGEFASSLLASQRAVPEKLLSAGFEFAFPTIEEALADLV